MIRRWTCNISAVLSLLLCIAVLAMLIYSYQDELGQWRGNDGQALRQIFVFHGRLVYEVDWLADKIEGVGYESESELEPWHWEEGAGDTYDLWQAGKRSGIAGFGYDNYSGPYQRGSMSFVLGTWHRRTYWAPLWAFLSASAILPAIVVRRLWHRLRQYGSGLCPQCGYNLTGNASGVCPECGTAIAATS